MTIRDTSEKLEHSLAARIIQVFITPGLIAITGTLGWMTLTDIKTAQALQTLKMEKTEGKISEVSGNVNLMNARMEYQVLNQLSDHQRRLIELENQNKERFGK